MAVVIWTVLVGAVGIRGVVIRADMSGSVVIGAVGIRGVVIGAVVSRAVVVRILLSWLFCRLLSLPAQA